MEIKIVDGRLEEFFKKSLDEQRFYYFYQREWCEDDGVDIILKLTETPKNVVLSRKKVSVVFSGDHFFAKTTERGVFIYNKLERKVKRNTFDKCELLEVLTYFPQFDWLKDARHQGNVWPTLFCDSIARDILLGKLTNAEDVVKKYLALNKIKGVNWKTFARYLHHSNRYPIAWIKGHTTNVNFAMEVMLGDVSEGDKKPTDEQIERCRIFIDMFKQAMALNVKINPRWSLNRMKDEHTKMTRELMKEDLEKTEQVDIYGECPQFDYPCKLLSTEREVFTEGMEMHHCVYTNYWHQIKEHKYLAFSFEAAERFTLGLKQTNNGWEFDQAYCKYDKQINEDSKVLIEQFLADPVVKNKLMGLADKGPVPYEATASVNPTVEDDEWLRSVVEAA